MSFHIVKKTFILIIAPLYFGSSEDDLRDALNEMSVFEGSGNAVSVAKSGSTYTVTLNGDLGLWYKINTYLTNFLKPRIK